MIARLIYLSVLLASALLLGLGMYYQYALHLQPCAPQVLVRYALVFAALFALIAVAIDAGKAVRIAMSVCIGLASVLGAVLAAHQSWPRHVPLNFAAHRREPRVDRALAPACRRAAELLPGLRRLRQGALEDRRHRRLGVDLLRLPAVHGGGVHRGTAGLKPGWTAIPTGRPIAALVPQRQSAYQPDRGRPRDGGAESPVPTTDLPSEASPADSGTRARPGSRARATGTRRGCPLSRGNASAETHMQRSESRILTTHTGSLPRPDAAGGAAAAHEPGRSRWNRPRSRRRCGTRPGAASLASSSAESTSATTASSRARASSPTSATA